MAQFDAIGFSPFGIERQVNVAGTPLQGVYERLRNLAPIILENQGKGTMAAARFLAENAPQKIKLGNYTAEISVARNRRSGHRRPRCPPRPS